MEILKSTWDRFSENRGTTMAAAIGFRAVFALAPLLLVAISIAGSIFGEEAAQGLLAARFEQLLGEELAADLEGLLASAANATTAGVIGFALLVWAGSGLFTEVQGALNTINGVERRQLQGVGKAIRERILTLVAVIGCAIGLVLLVGSATMAAWLPADWASEAVAVVASAVIFFLALAVSFRSFTPYRPPWAAVLLGALATEVAILVAAILVGLFVSRAGGGTATGIAGSVVAILLVVYLLSSVYLVGAAFTRALADSAPFVARSSVPVDL